MPNARFRLLALGLVLVLSARATSADPTDAFGDPLPKGAKARLGTTRGVLIGHSDITALPPDYKSFAAVDSRKEVVIFDMASGRARNRLIPEKEINLQLGAVSADGKRLVTMGQRGVTVWEIASGRQLATIPRDPDTPPTAQLGSNLFSLSADGKFLAMGGLPKLVKERQDSEVVATVWDVEKKERLARVVVPHQVVLAPLLSPDGKTLATWGLALPQAFPAGAKSTQAPPPRPSPDPAKILQLWDVATGKEGTRIRMAHEKPSWVEFSPDGRTIAAATTEHWTVAVGTPDGLIERWDTRTGEPKVPLRVSGYLRAAFSPDGKTLAAVAADGIVRRWETTDGRLLGETKVPLKTSRSLGFTDNERIVVWSEGNSICAEAWEVPSRKLLTPPREHASLIAGIGFTADGKEVVTSGHDTRLVRWDAATGKTIGSVTLQVQLPTGYGFGGASIAPNATRAFSVYGVSPAVYDTATGDRVFSLARQSKPNVREAFLAPPDLSRVVRLAVPQDAKATTAECEVWDVGTQKKIKEFTWTVVNEFGDRLIDPTSFQGDHWALSPDGTQLVTLGNTKAPPRVAGNPPVQPVSLIVAWDLQTGKRLSVTETPYAATRNRSIAVSGDSGAAYRAGVDSLWAVDLERGHLGFKLDSHRQQAANISPVFSPDGKLFAVALAAEDGRYGVRVYDWPRGKVQHTFTGHVGLITAIAFSPDGKTLATGSQDTTVLLWDLSVISK